jgi:3-hydroxybutyryl-CoA dehydrogenase
MNEIPSTLQPIFADMKIAVRALPRQKEELLSKQTSGSVQFLWVENDIPAADAYFDLYPEEGNYFENVSQLVFVNAVIKTCNELPANAIRINAWNGFLARSIVEVAASNEEKKDQAEEILNKLGWNYQFVSDIPGMISTRTIAMIVNEAYFALGDNISTKEEIDIAMKLGTNYPYGPFEWSERFGLHNIYSLLKKLTEFDKRYEVAPALEQELKTLA